MTYYKVDREKAALRYDDVDASSDNSDDRVKSHTYMASSQLCMSWRAFRNFCRLNELLIRHRKTYSAGCASVYVSSLLSLDKMNYYKIHRETATIRYDDVDDSSEYSNDRMTSHTYMASSQVCILWRAFRRLCSLNDLLHTSQQNVLCRLCLRLCIFRSLSW
jgi:hypothetical protein